MRHPGDIRLDGRSLVPAAGYDRFHLVPRSCPGSAVSSHFHSSHPQPWQWLLPHSMVHHLVLCSSSDSAPALEHLQVGFAPMPVPAGSSLPTLWSILKGIRGSLDNLLQAIWCIFPALSRWRRWRRLRWCLVCSSCSSLCRCSKPAVHFPALPMLLEVVYPGSSFMVVHQFP